MSSEFFLAEIAKDAKEELKTEKEDLKTKLIALGTGNDLAILARDLGSTMTDA
jgi:hypothetical protein